MSEPRILKRSVVKEELVALTGHFMEALILNQFVYWTTRVKEYDQMLQEEIALARRGGVPEPGVSPKYGWIYKKAEELSEELMVGISASTIRRYISNLVEKGYISERNNPVHSWDKTKQYRVNLARLQRDLAALGYPLDGYTLPENGSPIFQNPSSNPQTAHSNSQNPVPNSHITPPNPQISAAIPESTPEITPENKADNTHYPAEFEAFWAAYPKQVNKWGAFREWQHAIKRRKPHSVSPAQLIQAAKNYAQSKRGVETRYLMKPAVFLGRDCCYLDYLQLQNPDSRGEVCIGSRGEDDETSQLIAQQTPQELLATLKSMPDDLVGPALWYIRSELQTRGYDVDRVEGEFVLCAIN